MKTNFVGGPKNGVTSADYLKIAKKMAYRFASEGKVPGFKVGSAWWFRKSEIDRWISEQERKERNIKT